MGLQGSHIVTCTSWVVVTVPLWPPQQHFSKGSPVWGLEDTVGRLPESTTAT